MPKNSGTGVYSPPPNITATPLAPIESADWNAFVNDVTATFNSVLLPAQGGTGQTSLTGLLGTIGGMPIAGGTFTGFVTLSGDATANLHAVTKQQHEAGLALKANTVHTHTTNQITDYATATDARIETAKSGMVIGVAHQMFSSAATINAIIPADDTIPQITEGTEVMSLSYTPKFANSRIVVEVSVMLLDAAANQPVIFALFRDTGANAKAASMHYAGATGQGSTVPAYLSFSENSGSTTATTYRVRVGTTSGGTLYFNTGISTTRVFGGVASSSITITEIKA